jgi:hypothetical protein
MYSFELPFPFIEHSGIFVNIFSELVIDSGKHTLLVFNVRHYGMTVSLEVIELLLKLVSHIRYEPPLLFLFRIISLSHFPDKGHSIIG